MISLEAVLWITGLTAIAHTVGSKIVAPLVAAGQMQASLNAESVTLIQAALSACGG